MKISQKDENRLGLYTVVLLNAVVLYGLVTTNFFEPRAWMEALTDLQLAVPAVLGLAFITVLNAQVSVRTKERIVFLEWEHPLPGCRAFTWHMPRDSRIDAAALSARYGPFPTEPGEQNRTWYRIYSGVRDDVAIVSLRRTYLFARDYAVLMVLMIPVFGSIALAQIRSPLFCVVYVLFLFLQYVFAANAARTSAQRWVTTVMAIAATK